MEVSKMRFLFLNIAFLAIYFNTLLFVVNDVYVWVCVGVSVCVHECRCLCQSETLHPSQSWSFR